MLIHCETLSLLGSPLPLIYTWKKVTGGLNKLSKVTPLATVMAELTLVDWCHLACTSLLNSNSYYTRLKLYKATQDNLSRAIL